MVRRRFQLLCLVVLLAVLLGGCSSIEEVGVSIDDTSGHLEVIGICTDRGLRRIEVRSVGTDGDEAGSGDVLYRADHTGVGVEPPRRVVLSDDLVGYDDTGDPVAVLDAGRIAVYADYDDPTIIGTDLIVDVEALDPAEVVVGQSSAATIVSRSTYDDMRRRCAPSPWILPLLAVMGLTAVLVLALLVRGFLLDRRRARRAGGGLRL